MERGELEGGREAERETEGGEEGAGENEGATYAIYKRFFFLMYHKARLAGEALPKHA